MPRIREHKSEVWFLFPTLPLTLFVTCASHLTYLSLSFLICKIEIVIFDHFCKVHWGLWMKGVTTYMQSLIIKWKEMDTYLSVNVVVQGVLHSPFHSRCVHTSYTNVGGFFSLSGTQWGGSSTTLSLCTTACWDKRVELLLASLSSFVLDVLQYRGEGRWVME